MNDSHRVPKILGADFELANSFIGQQTASPRQAAATLLAEIQGFPSGSRGGSSIEYNRRFLDTCGSSWYIDSDHLEGNLPEHTSAMDHANVLHGAGFRQAQQALNAVKFRLPAGTRLNLLANCSDGRTAWGTHLNVMMSRCRFVDLMYHKPHQAAFFASHLVTSIPFTGQGMVGASNGRPACSFQLSQRADWFENIYGQQTMYERPLLNLRDESHASDDLARAHIIFYDMVLAPIANILKAGTTQLILAMIEAGWADPTLCLDDPIAAAAEISRDLGLDAQLATAIRGRRMSAIEIQQSLCDLAGEFVAAGEAKEFVPDAEQIVALWTETLDLLRQRDIEALAGRCDAWLKYLLLDRQRGRHALSWTSDSLRVADSLFASLDPETSLFYQAAANGIVECMPDEATIEHYNSEPPDDTRAYFRAHVLRRFGDSVSSMDWSYITFRVPSQRHWWATAKVPMNDPRRFHREETEALIEAAVSLEDLVDWANSLAEQFHNTH